MNTHLPKYILALNVCTCLKMVNIKMGYNSGNFLQELFDKKNQILSFCLKKKIPHTHTHTQKLKFNQSIPNNTACDNTYNKYFKKYKKFKA